MTEPDYLYAWQVFENGQWGTIATIVPQISAQQIPLVFRSEEVAMRVEAFARDYEEKTNLPVKLRAFVFESDRA